MWYQRSGRFPQPCFSLLEPFYYVCLTWPRPLFALVPGGCHHLRLSLPAGLSAVGGVVLLRFVCKNGSWALNGRVSFLLDKLFVGWFYTETQQDNQCFRVPLKDMPKSRHGETFAPCFTQAGPKWSVCRLPFQVWSRNCHWPRASPVFCFLVFFFPMSRSVTAVILSRSWDRNAQLNMEHKFHLQRRLRLGTCWVLSGLSHWTTVADSPGAVPSDDLCFKQSGQDFGGGKLRLQGCICSSCG